MNDTRNNRNCFWRGKNSHVGVTGDLVGAVVEPLVGLVLGLDVGFEVIGVIGEELGALEGLDDGDELGDFEGVPDGDVVGYDNIIIKSRHQVSNNVVGTNN